MSKNRLIMNHSKAEMMFFASPRIKLPTIGIAEGAESYQPIGPWMFT